MPTTNHADASKTSANSFAKLFQVPGFDANIFVKFQHRNLEALNGTWSVSPADSGHGVLTWAMPKRSAG